MGTTQILDSRVHRNLDSGFHSPGLWITKPKICWIPDSGFLYM